MNLRRIRSILRLIYSLLLGVIYILHILLYRGNFLINSDLEAIESQIGIKLPRLIQLLYHLHNNRYYR